MADRSFILFPSTAGWSIAAWPPLPKAQLPIPFSVQTSPTEIASNISAALQAMGYRGNAVALCVPSEWCLCASFSIEDLPRQEARAMLFRMEENLPLAAEAVIADFIVHKDSALGICARLDAVAPITAALEAAGIAVQTIVPAVMAIAQGFAESATDCVLLCSEPESVDGHLISVIVLQNGSPIRWAVVPGTARDLKMQLDLVSSELGSVPHIQAVDIGPELVDEMLETTERVIEVEETAGVVFACKFAASVLKGRVKPWAEFRRDRLGIADPIRLYRRWIDASLAAAIALMLSLTLVFLMRGHRYQQLDQASTGEMIAAFHEHFPGWETPVNVRAVIDAQFRRASGTAGQAPGTRASALLTLHDVLGPMMSQEHLRISRMAFHENAFEISGHVGSYEELDTLSKLAGQSGMIVAPAQSRKDTDGSWTFVLQGSRPPEAVGK